ncbi:T9SS type A sorting domain-containing protein [Hymenobacter segetis]|uniref:T9SS type A sorting domain-containing protein n=1 Tax=Hymenobacter segetis TaxID=2025509 RepID=A0ABU9M0E4_9BACT
MPKAALLLISFLLLLSATAQAQNTYYWRGAVGANWSTSTSWNTAANGTGTARTTRNSGDVLIFNGGSPVVTMDLSETIKQLSFTNNTAATLNTTTDATRTITLGGGTGEDFVVAAGSSLAVVGVVSDNDDAAVIFQLNNSVTASIAGAVTFTSSGGNGGSNALHEFRGGEGSVHFTNGGSLIATGRMNGDSFGTTAGMAVFEAGATYQQNGSNADDPYGPATFLDGSTYRYLTGSFGGTTLTVNRAYGNLSYESSSDRTIGGLMNLLIRNNLTLSGTGNLSLNARNTDGTSIGGNISITNNSALLNFDPSSTRPVTLNGTTAKTVSGVGALVLGDNAQLEIDNPAGVTLMRPITVESGLILTNGLLTTSATALLTLDPNATISGGSATSFVNGPLARITPANNSVNRTWVFPIGKGTAYRPLTLRSSDQNNAATYTVEQFEGNPGQTVTGLLQRVSFKRAYSIISSSASATNLTGTVTISFAPDDYVNVPGTSDLVVARRQGTTGAWSTIGHSANTGPAGAAGGPGVSGTITSNSFTGFTTGSATYFALGALNLNNQANPFSTAVNPLPVELTRFDAAAKPQGIALSWATATEKNSDYFEVQRSADGEIFQRVGSVKGQGTSSNAHEYAFLDGHPLAGLSYYRLRQVDTDGTSTFSPVATVQMRGEVAVYPNPSTGTVSLPATMGAVRYRVLNALGQAVLSGQATGSDQLDLHTLAKGSYFLELTGAGGSTIQRLMRE